MRDVVLTIFLVLAVVFGGTHAYAFSHDHDSAHAGSLDPAAHDAEEQSDEQMAADSQGTEIAHGHSAMDAAPYSRSAGQRLIKSGSLLPTRKVMALPSIGIKPPLEPPSV